MLRLLSYNVRYDTPVDGEHGWPHRRERVATLLARYQPDLIGLQEVRHNQLHDLLAHLPAYDWVGVGREDGASAGEYVPIFYRRARFNLIDHATFWLSATPMVAGSRGWDAAHKRIVTWARFLDKESGVTLLHLNTHFDHRGEIARLESAHLLRRFIAEQTDDIPLFVSGDFNCTSDMAPYQTLTMAEAGQPPLLYDAMRISESPHCGPEATTNNRFRDPLGGKIDYIFCRSAPYVRVLRHDVLVDQWDGCYPSDHLPVLVDFAG
jgi:endonuclease/exonuclease/phosphatase family metal-dependent hydrolase